jgi:hypothetical protein
MKKRKAELSQGTLELLVLRLLRSGRFNCELTAIGRKQLEAERREWERFSGAVALILRDA